MYSNIEEGMGGKGNMIVKEGYINTKSVLGELVTVPQ